jgi:hypothetical protein
MLWLCRNRLVGVPAALDRDQPLPGRPRIGLADAGRPVVAEVGDGPDQVGQGGGQGSERGQGALTGLGGGLGRGHEPGDRLDGGRQQQHLPDDAVQLVHGPRPAVEPAVEQRSCLVVVGVVGGDHPTVDGSAQPPPDRQALGAGG